jgi:hypothetical protein
VRGTSAELGTKDATGDDESDADALQKMDIKKGHPCGRPFYVD